MGTYIPSALRQEVYDRAGGCCEYCLIPETAVLVPHEVDHIIAQKHGGLTESGNLALSCTVCNKYKGAFHAPHTRVLSTARLGCVERTLQNSRLYHRGYRQGTPDRRCSRPGGIGRWLRKLAQQRAIALLTLVNCMTEMLGFYCSYVVLRIVKALALL